MKKILSVIPWILVSHSAVALVNPIDLSMSETQNDVLYSDLVVSRNFSSQRTGDGLFGKGWCSFWETQIKTNKNQTEFQFCGAGKKILFDLALKTETPGYRLSKRTEGFTVNAGDQTIFSFNQQGQLISLVMDKQNYQLTYAQNRLAKIKNATRAVEFSVKDGHVAAITGTNVNLQYVYERGLLTKVIDNKNIVNQYEYNNKDQMVTWKNIPDAIEKRYTYRGKAIESVETGGCKETLTSSLKGKAQSVTVKKQCADKSETVKTFEINGGNRQAGQTVKERSPAGVVTSRTWDRGLLVENQTPQGTVKYTHDKSGQIKEAATASWKFQVNQRTAGRPQQVTMTEFPSQKKTTLHVTWQKGQMTAMKIGSISVNVSTKGNALSFSGTNFRLSFDQSAKGSFVGGMMQGQTVAPFYLSSDLSQYSSTQLQALSQMTSLVNLKDSMESL